MSCLKKTYYDNELKTFITEEYTDWGMKKYDNDGNLIAYEKIADDDDFVDSVELMKKRMSLMSFSISFIRVRRESLKKQKIRKRRNIMGQLITEEMLDKQRLNLKKQVRYTALIEYKEKILKQIEKEKINARKSSDRLKDILADNPTKAKRTSANAKCSTLWENIRYLELKLEVLEELIKEE